MTTRFHILFLISFLLFACSSKIDKHSKDISTEAHSFFSSKEADGSIEKTSSEGKYPDGIYCAEVKYHNPNTGTHSSYKLTVTVKNNEVIQVDFPNGGRLDNSNFRDSFLNNEGYTHFVANSGYKYSVQIIGNASECFAPNVPQAKQCRGITKSGTRCKHMTDNANGLCWQHQNQE
jgi:hypothetical protein